MLAIALCLDLIRWRILVGGLSDGHGASAPIMWCGETRVRECPNGLDAAASNGVRGRSIGLVQSLLRAISALHLEFPSGFFAGDDAGGG